jgi:hypothetical protein
VRSLKNCAMHSFLFPFCALFIGLNIFALPCQFPNQALGVDQCKRTGYKCLGLTLDPYAIVCDDGYVIETKSDGNHICRKIEVAISCQEISNLFKSNPVNKREVISYT